MREDGTVTGTTTIDADDREISFADEGEGPVSLVLVSDRSVDRDGLGVIAHYLAEEAGFRVIRIGTEPVDEASVQNRTSDVLAVLDRLGLEDTWVGGHGAGGAVARAFAAEHTDRVNGLLLMGVEEDSTPLAPLIPVLIIQGAEDEVTPAERAEALRATAPERASIKTIEGAGHDFPLTHPIDAAVIIEEYLDWD